MRRNVGGHTHSNARAAIYQQVRHPRRQYVGHGEGVVVVVDEIHRVFVEIGQQLRSHLCHAHFGITHRRWRVGVNGAKVSLAVDQQITHREILSHTHHGFVHRAVAVRVIFTNHITHHASRLNVRPVMSIVEFVHSEQNPFVYWF